MRTVAALYIDPRGPYPRMDGVDCWDESRDATGYAGPWPVVAHPPCARWCRLAKFVAARGGAAVGADGGTFAAALAAVRTFGGVLEHPAWSLAWSAHGLPLPPSGGGWVRELFGEGWACHVEQGHYGHKARKASWLYAVGVPALPSLRWGPSKATYVVSTTRGANALPELSAQARRRAPEAFKMVLLSLARSVP